jgi:hypothetical protein
VSGKRRERLGLRTRSWAKRAVVAFATTLTLVVGVTAASAAHHHPQPPRLIVTSKPAAGEEGTKLVLDGQVKGHLKHSSNRYTAAVQLAQNGHFDTVGTAHLRKQKFELDFVAPAQSGTIDLRVQLLSGGKQVAVTKPWKFVVKARAGAAATLQGGPTPEKRTLVISPGNVGAAPGPGEPGILRLTGVGGVNPGDIVAIGIGPNTPDGFLGRVISVQQVGGELVLDTVPAELPEALPEGEFDQEVEAEEIDTASPSSASAQTSSISSGAPAAIKQSVSASISCSASAKVQVSGNVAINPKIEISGGWGPFSGLHAKFIASVSASTELAALADAAANCKVGPQTLFKRVLRPIEFTVGPVPVVVVPIVSAALSAEGEVQAFVESEVHASITAKAGIEYSHGGAHPVAGFEKDFGWTPPEPTGTAHLEAKVSPQLDLLVYGVAGPTATFNAGLAVDADTSADPEWTLTAPVSLTAKLAVPALGISTGTLTVYQHSFLLAQAGENGIQGQIHFDELPEETIVTDQYSDEGVVFDTPVFITSDGSNPTSPVLSGEPRFEGPISGHFVIPGTNTPTTVNFLELDAGYIDNPGSVEIVAHLANGQTRIAVADHLGIDQISMATRGIQSFTVQEVSEEAAGFAIDNLGFSR